MEGRKEGVELNIRKYNAIIFDLGGTLSPSAAWSEYRDAATKVAEICRVPVDTFVEAWFSRSEGLGTGLFPSYQNYIDHICGSMGLSVPRNLIDLAGEIPVYTTRKNITVPREGAIELLSFLKSGGYKIGLITDCGPDVPQIWPETPFAAFFDIVIFSCTEGMNKGNPAIFELAARRLAVQPEKCLYIADGNRNELANACNIGMDALRLFVPDEVDENNPLREEWHGQVISSLTKVIDHL